MRARIEHLVFLLALAAVPAFVFFDIGTRFVADGVASGSAENNAAMYPRLVAAIMAALVALQAGRSLLAADTVDDAEQRSDSVWQFLQRYGRVTAAFVLFLLYLWAFRWFGFVYATPVFAALMQMTLGVRNPIIIGVYAAGLTGIIWFAFSELLNLALPAGDYFG